MLHPVGQPELGVVGSNLAPSFIVNDLEYPVSQVFALCLSFTSSYPSGNAGEALVLVDQQLKLTRELGLLSCIRQNRLHCAVGQSLALQRPQRGHILDHQETKLITSLVEQIVLDFDLCKYQYGLVNCMDIDYTHMLADHVEAQLLQQLKIIHHGFLRGRRIDTVRPESLVQSAEHEHKFTIQQWPDDPIDSALGDSPEPCVALDLVSAHLDSHIVQVR